MGTTATSLHILRLPENAGSLSDEIERAYRRLGCAKPKKPAGTSAKQVILVGRDDDDFLSIYDSENDEIGGFRADPLRECGGGRLVPVEDG